MNAKIGRNEKCPCGSGRKYKHCHGGLSEAIPEGFAVVAPIPPQRVLDAFLDEQQKNVVVVSNDFLLVSLQRDSPKISEDFDRQFEAELRLFNEEFCKVMNILIHELHLDTVIATPELRSALVFLLTNAAQTFVAALDLLRHGHRLQPGILIRGLIEQLTTICHLIQKPEDLQALKSHKLGSADTIGSAKKLIPIFGSMYGLFSNSFALISQLHLSLNPVVPYTRDDETLRVNFSFLRLAVWFLYVVAEITFYQQVQRPRYWTSLGRGGYQYNPDAAEQAWMDTFLSEDLVGHRVGSLSV